MVKKSIGLKQRENLPSLVVYLAIHVMIISINIQKGSVTTNG